MKPLMALTLAAGTLVLAGCSTTPRAHTWKQTYSSFDLPAEHPAKELAKRDLYKLQNVSLPDTLALYGKLAERTVIAGQLPNAQISLSSPTPLNRIEALQMLDTVLAQHGIAMVLSGDRAVKAVPVGNALLESPPEITLPWSSLPESSSLMRRTVHLKHLRPSETVPALAPYSHLSGSMIAMDSEQILVLQDYAANVRQQLKLLEELEHKHSMD